MPTEVGGYHLFQLNLAQEIEESIQFEEFMYDFGDGYDSEVLIGADTGVRMFSMQYRSIHQFTTSATVVLDGAVLTPADYLWALYTRQKVTGQPFVMQSKRDNQYYLVKFADKQMTMRRMLTRLYSTGLNFKQNRIAGVSVFDPSLFSEFVAGWKVDDFEVRSYSDGASIAHDLPSYVKVGTAPDMTIGGGVPTWEEDETPNGSSAVRLNSVDYMTTDQDALLATVHQAFLVCKVNEATFSGDSNLLSSWDVTLFTGDDTTTKLIDEGIGVAGYEYRKDGTAYLESAQEAPMNEWAVLYGQWTAGKLQSEISISRFISGYCPMDWAELIVTDEIMSDHKVRQTIEHLIAKWLI